MKLRKKLRGGLRWARSRFVDRGAVLLYHRIAKPENDRFKLCVSPENFGEQMAVLSKSGLAIRLTDLVRKKADGDLRGGAVAVTFDDGYLDNLRAALPVLEKYRIPATVFVVTGNLGGRFWWDRLGGIFEGCPELPEKICIHLPGGDLNLNFGGRVRRKTLDAVYPDFRKLEPAEREEALDQLGGMLGEPEPEPDSGRRSVSVSELGELADHPLITIGAHTVNHGQLAELDPEQQRREILGSKETLEKVLGRKVTTFSYPFGLRGRDFTGETMRIAEEAGLECALAADLDVVTRLSDAYALPRLWVHNWGGEKFAKSIGRWTPLSEKVKSGGCARSHTSVVT